MKKIIIIGCLALGLVNSYACTDIFAGDVNVGYVEGRSLDFSANLGTDMFNGYPAQLNYTRIVPLDKVPITNLKLATWRNLYGFTGRVAWDSNVVMDGLNTQGLAVSTLELSIYKNGSNPYVNATIYKSPGDSSLDPKKESLSFLDIPNMLLGNASTIAEAEELIKKFNIVNSAAKMDANTYINLGLHYVITDKSGGRLIVEFLKGDGDGSPVFIKGTNATALTNNRSDTFDNIDGVEFPIPTKEYTPTAISTPIIAFGSGEIKFVEFLENTTNGFHNYADSFGRLYRAFYLYANIQTPKSMSQALYNVETILSAEVVPYNEAWGTETEYLSIKDLSVNKLYYKDFMTAGSVPTFDQSLSNWKEYDLNNMGLDVPKPDLPGLQAFNQADAPNITIVME